MTDLLIDTISRTRVMVIARDLSVQETLALAERAWAVGVRVFEVPIQSDGAVAALAAVSAASRPPDALVGAGTVTTTDRWEVAMSVGAQFTVAPGLHPSVVEASRAACTPHMPGVATATEVQAALDLGIGCVKVFPAAVLGPLWLRAMRGPFPQMRCIAVGGVETGNARTFFDAGAVGVGVGAAVVERATSPQGLADIVAVVKGAVA